MQVAYERLCPKLQIIQAQRHMVTVAWIDPAPCILATMVVAANLLLDKL